MNQKNLPGSKAHEAGEDLVYLGRRLMWAGAEWAWEEGEGLRWQVPWEARPGRAREVKGRSPTSTE